MKTTPQVIDYTATGAGSDLPKLLQVLIRTQRALVLAEVPGIRCTNKLSGEQQFEVADGTLVALSIDSLVELVRQGKAIPSPREVLSLFGKPCFSTLPCGAPIPFDKSQISTLTTPFKAEKE